MLSIVRREGLIFYVAGAPAKPTIWRRITFPDEFCQKTFIYI